MKDQADMVKVMVFDLNGTFYNKSSKDEFYKFIISKRPNRVKYYIQMVYYKVLLKVHQIKQTEFKENFFNYLDNFPPEQVRKYATEFWKQEYPDNFNKKLLKRFADLKGQNVVIFCATGGLELYVQPLFDLYKIDGFAGTCVAYTGHTYLVEGKASKGEEKINRLEEFLEGQTYRISEAYSDSKEVILEKAEKAYLIKDGVITSY